MSHCDHDSGFSHCSECCEESAHVMYVRMRELEVANARMLKTLARAQEEGTANVRRIRELEAECERLREALKYYARADNWGIKPKTADHPRRRRDWYGNGWHGFTIAQAALWPAGEERPK